MKQPQQRQRLDNAVNKRMQGLAKSKSTADVESETTHVWRKDEPPQTTSEEGAVAPSATSGKHAAALCL